MTAKKILCSALLSVGIFASSLTPALASQGTDSLVTDSVLSSSDIKKNDSFSPKISAIDDIIHPTFISGELTEKSDQSPEKIVEKYYGKNLFSNTSNEIAMQFKLDKPVKKDKQFKKTEQYKNKRGKTIIKTTQTYNGVPVFGTNQSYIVNSDGVIECVIGSTVEDIESKVTSSESSIHTTQQDALNAVESNLGFKPEYVENPKFDMVLYPVGDKYVYSYMVSVDYIKPKFGGYTYYVDANSLSILEKLSHVASAEQAATGTGIGQQFGNQTEQLPLQIVHDDTTNTYYLQNITDNFKTVNKVETRFSELNDNCFDSGTSTNYQQDAVDAHYNITYVLDFFEDRFSRIGTNDDPSSSAYKVMIDETNTEVNAYGSQDRVQFCTGRGSANRSMACCLDVAAHEFTHGMLFAEGLLDNDGYQESDSLHEGLADVFGTVCEYFYFKDNDTVKHSGTSFDWNNAEDAIISRLYYGVLSVGARDCANPIVDSYDKYIAMKAESHLGGGVITKAAYLIAEGGTHNGKLVAAISNDKDTAYSKLAEIFYEVIDNHMSLITNFEQFANTAVYSAEELYPNTSAAQTVHDAFAAVGVLVPEKAPTNFAEIGRNGMNIDFSWNGTSGHKYAIYRRNIVTNTLDKLTETTNTTSTVETIYGSWDYLVVEVDVNGDRISGYSNAVTIAIYKPAPQNLVVTGVNGLNVSLSWQDTSPNAYVIIEVVKPGVAGGTSDVSETGTCTIACLHYDSYNISVAEYLTNGTLYNRISEYSNVVTVDTRIAAVENLRMTGRNGSNIEFSWDGTAGNNYSLYRKFTASTSAPEKVTGSSTNGTSASIVALNGMYDYYVVQETASGERMSHFGNPVSVENYLEAPTNFVIRSIDDNMYTVSWDGPVRRCAIFYRSTGTTSVPTRSFNPIVRTTETIYALSGSNQYFVAEVDAFRNRISEFSNALTIEWYRTAPANFQMTSKEGSLAQFSWDETLGNLYKIYCKPSGSADDPVEVTNTAIHNTTGSAVTLDGTYDYFVAEVNTLGNRITEYSNAVTITNYSAPTNFTMSYKSGLSVEFTWNGTSGSNYSIYRKVTGTTGDPVRVTELTTNTICSLDTLTGSYDYCVAKVDSNGNRLSDFSNVFTVPTYEFAPSNFTMTSHIGVAAFFSWGGTSGNNYKIYKRATGTTDALEEVYETTNTTGFAYVYDGSYDFYVAQVDSNGYRISNYSNVVIVEAV
jgi:Zn-dependent metalloprotease